MCLGDRHRRCGLIHRYRNIFGGFDRMGRGCPLKVKRKDIDRRERTAQDVDALINTVVRR
jgi:hypothetical protein